MPRSPRGIEARAIAGLRQFALTSSVGFDRQTPAAPYATAVIASPMTATTPATCVVFFIVRLLDA